VVVASPTTLRTRLRVSEAQRGEPRSLAAPLLGRVADAVILGGLRALVPVRSLMAPPVFLGLGYADVDVGLPTITHEITADCKEISMPGRPCKFGCNFV